MNAHERFPGSGNRGIVAAIDYYRETVLPLQLLKMGFDARKWHPAAVTRICRYGQNHCSGEYDEYKKSRHANLPFSAACNRPAGEATPQMLLCGNFSLSGYSLANSKPL